MTCRLDPDIRLSQYLLRRPAEFMSWGARFALRPYQVQAILPVVESVRRSSGLSFVWIFPRQSGKDEALALLLTYLLALDSDTGGETVFLNPTLSPQGETSMRRLETRLDMNTLTQGRWKRTHGYIYSIGKAFCTYLSASPSARIVGATANRLLVVNEAQDISPLKYDKEIEPMVASANATRLFAGTRWTSDTLLEREYRAACADQARDGWRRVFFFTAREVRGCLPAYGLTVDRAVARLGRQHPLVKTQYFCETVDAQVSLFPPARQALMRGSHAARSQPEPGKLYAFLIDVAGQDEQAGQLSAAALEHALDDPARDPAANAGRDPATSAGRDSTALKIVEVGLGSLKLQGRPTYLAVFRREWVGQKHVRVFEAIQALAQLWKPLHIVIDATGVGEGLWSLLDNAFGGRVVVPVKFTARLKSDLGYGFIGMIESGRYREYSPFPEHLRRQMDACRAEIVPGPGKLMRWGVPDGTRDPVTGDLLHDDDLMTSALCHQLDRLEWYLPLPTTIIRPKDPLREMDRNF